MFELMLLFPSYMLDLCTFRTVLNLQDNLFLLLHFYTMGTVSREPHSKEENRYFWFLSRILLLFLFLSLFAFSYVLSFPALALFVVQALLLLFPTPLLVLAHLSQQAFQIVLLPDRKS